MKDKRETVTSGLYMQSRFRHRSLIRWVIPLAIQLLTLTRYTAVCSIVSVLYALAISSCSNANRLTLSPGRR